MATNAKLKTVENALQDLDAMGPLGKLRQPFDKRLISKLPKETKAQTEDRKNNRNGVNCTVCGGWHHPKAVHLDYVGHAALTDRLLDTDPLWTWEPVGFTPEGLPALDRNGGLWIKLTVCGVTRFGYGAADGKSGGDAMKEMIGDALRNAAMRFGAALDLWHKGDLHAEEEEKQDVGTGETPANKREKLPDLELKDGSLIPAPYPFKTHLMTAGREFVRTLNGFGDLEEFTAWGKEEETQLFLRQLKRDLPGWWAGGADVPADWVPIEILISQKKRDLEQVASLKERA